MRFPLGISTPSILAIFLTLFLFVTRFFADDAYDTAAFDYSAVFANFFD
jgi:hypothetical protein